MTRPHIRTSRHEFIPSTTPWSDASGADEGYATEKPHRRYGGLGSPKFDRTIGICRTKHIGHREEELINGLCSICRSLSEDS